MGAYLVRIRHSKELVGIFVSPSVRLLWRYVDDDIDVRECEFLRLPAGGVYVVDRETPTVPTIADAARDLLEPYWFGGVYSV